MGTKAYIWIGIFVGSSLGSWGGSVLDHGNFLGTWSIILGTLGALLGIWAGYMLGNYVE